jgi:hypothetical protein
LLSTWGRPLDPRSYQGEQRRDHHGAHVEQDAQANETPSCVARSATARTVIDSQFISGQTAGEDAGAVQSGFGLKLGPRFAAKALYRNCA